MREKPSVMHGVECAWRGGGEGEGEGGRGREVVRELKMKPSKEIFVLCQRCSKCLVSDVGTLIASPAPLN